MLTWVERRHRTRHKHIAADNRAFADNRIPAKDRRPGVDCDIVLNRRMAFQSAEHLAEMRRQRTQRDALVNLHISADFGGFADNDAGAVVNKERLPELRFQGGISIPV